MDFKIILIVLNSLIFFSLALLHFYWVFGGRKGLDAAVPSAFQSKFTDSKTKKTFAFATLLVGMGLVFCGVITLMLALESHFAKTIVMIIGIVFLLRAIGDFKYVGFFKKENLGKFAQRDTQFYSPLCLYLGTSLLYLIF